MTVSCISNDFNLYSYNYRLIFINNNNRNVYNDYKEKKTTTYIQY